MQQRFAQTSVIVASIQFAGIALTVLVLFCALLASTSK